MVLLGLILFVVRLRVAFFVAVCLKFCEKFA